jgi:hypothetical protein
MKKSSWNCASKCSNVALLSLIFFLCICLISPVRCVNNASPSFPNNFKNALEQFDVNEDGLIDYSEFVELDRRYPLVLFPAFRLQDMMQRKTLGKYCNYVYSKLMLI